MRPRPSLPTSHSSLANGPSPRVREASYGAVVSDGPPEPDRRSTPKAIRDRVINLTVGQWIRAVDLVISHYEPSGLSLETEAEHVAKAAVFTMLRRWFDEDTVCLLIDSTSLKIPRRISDSSSHEIASVIDRPPSGEGVLDDLEPDDPDAPPGPDGPSLTLPPGA